MKKYSYRFFYGLQLQGQRERWREKVRSEHYQSFDQFMLCTEPYKDRSASASNKTHLEVNLKMDHLHKQQVFVVLFSLVLCFLKLLFVIYKTHHKDVLQFSGYVDG